MIFVIFGILLIWYKRKTALATSTVGQLHKLIPLLKEQKPSLNSLLPILSEFVRHTKSTNLELLMLVPKNHHLPVMNIQYLQWFHIVVPNPTN